MAKYLIVTLFILIIASRSHAEDKASSCLRALTPHSDIRSEDYNSFITNKKTYSLKLTQFINQETVYFDRLLKQAEILTYLEGHLNYIFFNEGLNSEVVEMILTPNSSHSELLTKPHLKQLLEPIARTIKEEMTEAFYEAKALNSPFDKSSPEMTKSLLSLKSDLFSGNLPKVSTTNFPAIANLIAQRSLNQYSPKYLRRVAEYTFNLFFLDRENFESRYLKRNAKNPWNPFNILRLNSNAIETEVQEMTIQTLLSRAHQLWPIHTITPLHTVNSSIIQSTGLKNLQQKVLKILGLAKSTKGLVENYKDKKMNPSNYYWESSSISRFEASQIIITPSALKSIELAIESNVSNLEALKKNSKNQKTSALLDNITQNNLIIASNLAKIHQRYKTSTKKQITDIDIDFNIASDAKKNFKVFLNSKIFQIKEIIEKYSLLESQLSTAKYYADTNPNSIDPNTSNLLSTQHKIVNREIIPLVTFELQFLTEILISISEGDNQETIQKSIHELSLLYQVTL